MAEKFQRKGFIMKKFTLIAVAAFAALVFVGCKSVSTSDGASMVPQIEAGHPGYAAKFDVKETRVAGEAQVNVLFGIFAWGTDAFAENSKLSSFSFLPSPANYAKSAAVYEACKASKADTLVGTRYVVTTTDYLIFKTVKCEVAGFPATMNGVEKLHPYAVGDKIFWLAEKPVAVK